MNVEFKQILGVKHPDPHLGEGKGREEHGLGRGEGVG